MSNGLCRQHGGGKECERPGCYIVAQSAGLCRHHGCKRGCAIDTCDALAKNRMKFCDVHAIHNNIETPEGGHLPQFDRIQSLAGICRILSVSSEEEEGDGETTTSTTSKLRLQMIDRVQPLLTTTRTKIRTRDIEPGEILTPTTPTKIVGETHDRPLLVMSATKKRKCSEEECQSNAQSRGLCRVSDICLNSWVDLTWLVLSRHMAVARDVKLSDVRAVPSRVDCVVGTCHDRKSPKSRIILCIFF